MQNTLVCLIKLLKKNNFQLPENIHNNAIGREEVIDEPYPASDDESENTTSDSAYSGIFLNFMLNNVLEKNSVKKLFQLTR